MHNRERARRPFTRSLEIDEPVRVVDEAFPALILRSPLLSIKLGNPKYQSWKSFVDNAYWLVDLK